MDVDDASYLTAAVNYQQSLSLTDLDAETPVCDCTDTLVDNYR